MNGTRKGSVRASVISTLQRIGQGSCDEIERRGQMAEGASRVILNTLRAENLARRCDWGRHAPNSTPHAIWELGSAPDEPRPKALGRANTHTNIPKQDPFERTDPLQMDYPVKSVFVGGVNPWLRGSSAAEPRS